MAFNTKLNLSDNKFEQLSGDTLTLSGETIINGNLVINSGGTINVNTDLNVQDDINTDNINIQNYQYIGNSGDTTLWRSYINENNAILFEKEISGSWFLGGAFSIPIPTVNSTARYNINNTLPNGDLIDQIGGANAIYISGTGLNAIYSFSGLSDNRFDKGAYVGNGFGLPEYYDFPWASWFYYDDSSEATRYHWKLKDFQYRYLQEQSLLLDDNFFGKAIYTDFGYGLDCTSSGIAYKENTNAYGQVFDGVIKKGNDINDINLLFLSDSIDGWVGAWNGYGLQFNSVEEIVLWKKTAPVSFTNLFRTAASYILNNTDYRILIWRNSILDEFVTGATGTFVVYIQGKNYPITETAYTTPNLSEMELVDVSGGTGTNPITDNTYTSSTYLVTDLDTGDKIRDITINDTLQDTYSFTATTGTYEVDNLESFPEAILYSTGLTGNNLTNILNYIGILPIFYGDDLVTNGGFNTDTDWTKQTGWTISGGTANCDGSQTGNSSIFQTAAVDSITGLVTYTISNYVSGNVRAVLGSNGIGSFESANGTYLEILTDTGTNNAFFIQGDLNFIGSIDNVSVKQVFEDYYKNEAQ